MAAGWTGPAVAVACLWLLVGMACLPVLAAARIRTAIEDWPTGRLAANYALLVGAVVLGQAAVFLGGVVVTGGFSGNAAVEWTLLVAAGYPLALWLAVSLVAPATGRWNPSGDGTGLDGRVVLGLAAAWYAVVVAAAAAVVFLVLFALYFPG